MDPRPKGAEEEAAADPGPELAEVVGWTPGPCLVGVGPTQKFPQGQMFS